MRNRCEPNRANKRCSQGTDQKKEPGNNGRKSGGRKTI